MNKDANGKYPYKGLWDCLKKSVQREKITGLWVGYPTFYFRVAPHSMIVLLVQDWLHMNFNKNHK